jgi:hypothetical protein
MHSNDLVYDNTLSSMLGLMIGLSKKMVTLNGLMKLLIAMQVKKI